MPTTNYGGDNNLLAGERNDADNTTLRSLLGFAILANIPAGASIISATLSIYLNSVVFASNSAAIGVYRLKREWVEDQVTWNIYSTGNSWATAGGFGSDD